MSLEMSIRSGIMMFIVTHMTDLEHTLILVIQKQFYFDLQKNSKKKFAMIIPLSYFDASH